MDKKRLRPCPFCGNPYVEFVYYPADGVRLFRGRLAVQCNYDSGGCGAEGGWRHSVEEARDVWNERRRKYRE